MLLFSHWISFIRKRKENRLLEKSGYNFHIDKTVMLFDRLQLERKQLRYVFKRIIGPTKHFDLIVDVGMVFLFLFVWNDYSSMPPWPKQHWNITHTHCLLIVRSKKINPPSLLVDSWIDKFNWENIRVNFKGNHFYWPHKYTFQYIKIDTVYCLTPPLLCTLINLLNKRIEIFLLFNSCWLPATRYDQWFYFGSPNTHFHNVALINRTHAVA